MTNRQLEVKKNKKKVLQSLTPDQLDMISFYVSNNMKRLRLMVDSLLSKEFGWIPECEYDDFYSDANEQISFIVSGYREDKNKDFESYLKSCLAKRIRTRITHVNRKKHIPRDRIEYIDRETEEGAWLYEKIASDFAMEQDFSFHKGTVRYLESLGSTQRKIADLIMEGYHFTEIKQRLNISDAKFNCFLSDMRTYEKRKLLEEKDCDLENKKEVKMHNIITTSEKTKNTSYAISAISKKLRRHQLRDDHVLQRASGQHNLITKSEFMSDILQGKALTQIIISEEIRNGITMYWLIDGKQRCTNIDDFLNDGFAISKNVQVYEIPYQTDKLDEEGKIIYNVDGFPVPEIKTCDIRNKKFSQLPEELQDIFREYQVPVLLNLNCTKKDIAYDIARFNRCRPMNIAQNGFTELDETLAEYVDHILKMDFFKIDCPKSSYTIANIKSGALRRMIVEAVVISGYIDQYDKNFGKMCKFLSENVSESVFIDFYTNIERLSSISSEHAAPLYNIKNSHLWFALFDKFTKLNVPDNRFADFTDEFLRSLHDKKINGITYDDLEENKNTKDRNYTKKKIGHLSALMLDFLHI